MNDRPAATGPVDSVTLDPRKDEPDRPPLMLLDLPFGQGRAWLARAYDDVLRVNTDQRLRRSTQADVPRLTAHLIPPDGALTVSDPPHHTRLRSVVAPFFRPATLERVRSAAESSVRTLLDTMTADRAPADLVEHVIRPFGRNAVGELVGIAEQDRRGLARWQRRFVSSKHSHPCANRAKQEMLAHIAAAVARRSDSSTDDLIGHLLRAERDGLITRAELVPVVFQFHNFGVLRFTGANIAYALLSKPDLRERLGAEPELVPPAVEEFLRASSIVAAAPGGARVATSDLSIGDCPVAAGDAVYSSYAAANRDPSVFDCPDGIRIDRSPNPHLAFGYGPHFCPAAPFARVILQTLVRALVEYTPTLELTAPEAVRWERDDLFRGPLTLPVSWRRPRD